jgi:hypothetical protein
LDLFCCPARQGSALLSPLSLNIIILDWLGHFLLSKYLHSYGGTSVRIIPFLPFWDYSVFYFPYLLIPWLRLSNNPKITDGSYDNAMATIEKELVQPVGASIHFDDYPSSGRGIIHLDSHRHHGQRNDLYSNNRQLP